ncbi:MAG: hypothetical protein MK078_00895 [Crocinitomicaceae bacterium]|nr:hypothetical protein [Crocinitomicaceae bacterium]
MKKLLIGISAAVILFGFFYVYKGEIFEAVIVEDNGTYTKDLPLSSLLFQQDLPEFVSEERLVEITPTLKSWVLMIAIFLGMPIMIALRFGKEQSNENS